MLSRQLPGGADFIPAPLSLSGVGGWDGGAVGVGELEPKGGRGGRQRPGPAEAELPPARVYYIPATRKG